MNEESKQDERAATLHLFEQAAAEQTAAEQAADNEAQQRYVLRLFVTGTTSRSIRAIANLHKICEEHLKGRYDLEVIDLYQQPELARGNRIVAVPTLIKQLPAPLRHLIGDLSNTDQVLIGLDLYPKP